MAKTKQKNERQNALDELFSAVKSYRRSAGYMELMEFISKFHRYSAFNAMLVHTQMPGAKYVLPAKRWREQHGRYPVENAQPLVMLQPMGPVMFGFDVSQTDGDALPAEFLTPFQAAGKIDPARFQKTLANARRDGVDIETRALGSTLGGYVRNAASPRHVIGVGLVSERAQLIEYNGSRVPLFARITLNSNVDDATNYGTLTHELGHLYCGHVGTPNSKWWPARTNLTQREREFEAESISYLVCRRAGLETPAAAYLNGYLKDNKEVPNISLDRVLRSSILIEQMGKKKMKKRKGPPESST
jgi:hypothetical protein